MKLDKDIHIALALMSGSIVMLNTKGGVAVHQQPRYAPRKGKRLVAAGRSYALKLPISNYIFLCISGSSDAPNKYGDRPKFGDATFGSQDLSLRLG